MYEFIHLYIFFNNSSGVVHVFVPIRRTGCSNTRRTRNVLFEHQDMLSEYPGSAQRARITLPGI